MISELLDILKTHEKIHAWNFKVISKDSYQLYFIKQKLDMNREVKTDEYIVNIYTKQTIKGKEKIGSASFQIYPSMTIEEVKEKIDQQVEYCKFTLSNSYSFPKKANLKPVSKELGFSNHSLKDAAFIAADALFEADKFDKGYINSSEIYINYIETRFFDSSGNVFLYTSEKGEIELVATWAEKGEEVELYKYFEFDNLDTIFIQKEAAKVIVEAGDRIKALKTPNNLGSMKVLLSEEYAKEYFFHFANKVSTDSLYENLSCYNIGSHFQNKNTKADKISIRLEPVLKNSTKGMPFDDDGIVLRRLGIIEKGMVKNVWGSNAKSQYLSKPVNGRFSNIVVNSGTLKKIDLEDETYLEVISLSGFEIDLLTGDFGSEIRLAYLYQKNKERSIVTGGSISGNIYESINNVRFFNETKQINNYIGPTKVLIDNIKVNGAQ